MSLPTVLLIVALICFIADALGLSSKVSLLAVGLVFFAGSFLIAAL